SISTASSKSACSSIVDADSGWDCAAEAAAALRAKGSSHEGICTSSVSSRDLPDSFWVKAGSGTNEESDLGLENSTTLEVFSWRAPTVPVAGGMRGESFLVFAGVSN